MVKNIYRIKIKNRQGSFLTSRKFMSKAKANKIVRMNKASDKALAGKGLVSLRGRPVKVVNRYTVVKVSK